MKWSWLRKTGVRNVGCCICCCHLAEEQTTTKADTRFSIGFHEKSWTTNVHGEGAAVCGLGRKSNLPGRVHVSRCIYIHIYMYEEGMRIADRDRFYLTEGRRWHNTMASIVHHGEIWSGHPARNVDCQRSGIREERRRKKNNHGHAEEWRKLARLFYIIATARR